MSPRRNPARPTPTTTTLASFVTARTSGVWLCAIGELLYVAVPAQMGQPIFIVPTLSLISNSLLFLALFQQLSPLAALGRMYVHH